MGEIKLFKLVTATIVPLFQAVLLVFLVSVGCGHPPIGNIHLRDHIPLKQFGVWRFGDYLASRGPWQERPATGE